MWTKNFKTASFTGIIEESKSIEIFLKLFNMVRVDFFRLYTDSTAHVQNVWRSFILKFLQFRLLIMLLHCKCLPHNIKMMNIE